MHQSVDQKYQEWAQRLRRWGLHQFAAAFLEASGPLNLIGAQLVYIGQPVLSGVFPAEQLTSMAQVLEDPKQTQAFIQCLREDPLWT